MSRPKKTLERVLRGGADANFAFRDICGMLEHLGFQCRIQGGHWIYEHPRVIGIMTLQPKSAKCKEYQIRQVRNLIEANRAALNIPREPENGESSEAQS